MLYQDKKSFFRKEFNSNDVGWGFIWVITLFISIAGLKEGAFEPQNVLLWFIFLMLGMIFDTLRLILKNSNRGL